MTENPIARFGAWLQEAAMTEINDPNAMTLATIGLDGTPQARIVLLKGVGDDGFVFYTNTNSAKGRELARHPKAALLFHWKSAGRQVRVTGDVTPVTPAEADAYFATRPRLSQLGAWASDQSHKLAARADLEARLDAAERRFADAAVPRPEYWSGYRLVPQRLEFWQNMPFRLHHREIFTRDGDGWATGLLFP